MKISLRWLRDFITVSETPEELRLILDDLGLVVEGVERHGEGLADVIVAQVKEIHAIQGADRVRRVIVTTGSQELEIVCGAMNFSVGDCVPLAPVGAVLPGGFEIALRKMRGITSNGMLCSARELELSGDHEGLMILGPTAASRIGERLIDVLGIEPDVIFDISVEGNRPDAWSVEGVARDLAARLNRTVSNPALATPNGPSTSSVISGAISDPELCGRLTISYLDNVQVAPSPEWVVQRLEAAGMRPISNVVDASNYVMLELGQPTHPYDASLVNGGHLGVRRARAGEVLKTLDGVERLMAKQGRGLGDTGIDCVIVDGQDSVLGLAGIMGGEASEISLSTTSVILEAAYFDPMTIARSSKRHGLRTEASSRFERGVDHNLALRAAARFVEVLRESSPGVTWFAEPIDLAGTIPATPTIHLGASDVERFLGVDIAPGEVARLLTALGFSVAAADGGLAIAPPTSRPDIRHGDEGRADVIEEIARLYGYKRIAPVIPMWTQPGGLSSRQALRRKIRDAIVSMGVFEAWTPSLGDHDDFTFALPQKRAITITNPLTAEESVLRGSLLPGLLSTWGKNLERHNGNIVMGEFGTVFSHPSDDAGPRMTRGGAGGAIELELPQERERLALVLGRDEDDATSAVAFALTLLQRIGLQECFVRSTALHDAAYHPTRSGEVVDAISGAVVGFVGEFDAPYVERFAPAGATRRVGVIDLDFDALCDPARATRVSQHVSVPSKFPSALMDLAFVTPDAVSTHDVVKVLRESDSAVERVSLFDVYRGASLGEGVRSLAFAIRLTAPDKTLTDGEISAIRERLIASAVAIGLQLR